MFQKNSYESLAYVYNSFLCNPFRDASAPRGPYIDEHGAYRQYPRNQPVTRKVTEVYRPNHGLAHNVRVTSKVRDVIALYADVTCNTKPESRRWFTQLNTPEEIMKLEIVGSFYVACRESEAGFKPEPDSPYQRYREASSHAFYEYAKTLKKTDGVTALFTENELQLYKTVLRDPYFDTSNDGRKLLASDETEAKKAAAKAVLSSCHALDLARCFHIEKMNHKIIEVLDPLGSVHTEDARKKVTDQFLKSEIQHILTGNKYASSFDITTSSFVECVIPEKNFLFRLAGTHPDIAIRLVSLSAHIKTVQRAWQLSVSLNRYAMQEPDALKTFLTRVENCFSTNATQTIDALLVEEKAIMKDTSRGRIFKTIRNDDADFWDDFAAELVNPAVQKKELRYGTRKALTVKLKNGKYEVVPTDKVEKRKIPGEEYSEADKKTYTRHQSTSYSNYAAGYNSPYFGHDTGRAELLVGISFAPEDCQLKRIMMYDGGTVIRNYDFDTKEKERAEKFIQEKLQSEMYHETLASLQESGLRRNANKHNEVMAKLRWTPHTSITVFSNNLESRLLAQLRAQDLKNRLEIKYPDRRPITVPITIYPEFLPYTSEQQAKDRETAKVSGDLKKYVIAIRFLTGEIINANNFPFESLNEVRQLIRKINAEKETELVNLITNILNKFLNMPRKQSSWMDEGIFACFVEFACDLERIKHGGSIDTDELKQVALILKWAETAAQSGKKTIFEAIESIVEFERFLAYKSLRSNFDLKQKFQALIRSADDIKFAFSSDKLSFYKDELIQAMKNFPQLAIFEKIDFEIVRNFFKYIESKDLNTLLENSVEGRVNSNFIFSLVDRLSNISLGTKYGEILFSIVNSMVEYHSQQRDSFSIDVVNLFFNALAKLRSVDVPDEIKNSIFKLKEKLSDKLLDYLLSLQKDKPQEFTNLCSKNTILGQLIDHHRNPLQGKKDTATRELVNMLSEIGGSNHDSPRYIALQLLFKIKKLKNKDTFSFFKSAEQQLLSQKINILIEIHNSVDKIGKGETIEIETQNLQRLHSKLESIFSDTKLREMKELLAPLIGLQPPIDESSPRL